MRTHPAAALLLLAVVGAAAPAGSHAAATKVTVTPTAIAGPLSGKSTKATVVIANAGGSKLSGLTVSLAAPKNVVGTIATRKGSAKRAELRALRAHRQTTLTVGLRAKAGAPAAGRATVLVKRRGKTVASGLLGFGGLGSQPGGAGLPPVNPNTLAGRYFWHSIYTLNGITQDSLYFTNDTLAFVGDASDAPAALPSCAAPSDTCKPYTYDGATNALTIDGKPATLQAHGVEFDGSTYGEFASPPAGSRWAVTVTYANSSGLCPLYCTYYREDLTFLADGTFAKDGVVSGSSPTVDFASIPPTRRGTYEVRADRTLALSFADGTQRVETVGVYVNDDGSLKAPGDGLLLGGEGYFDISTS